jgi:hypothetical protein
MDSIFNRWEWYIAGPLIGLFVPLILIAGNKLLGISSSFLHLCSLVLKKNLGGYDSEKHKWKFYFVVGILIGGFISAQFLTNNSIPFLPESYYSFPGSLHLLLGGILVGFGTRYANGCTSGHSISGMSTLQLSGLVATMSFFAGGLLYVYILNPFFG